MAALNSTLVAPIKLALKVEYILALFTENLKETELWPNGKEN